jgi:acyl-coenzyme A thioesterase PaaI-like protein
MATTGHHSADIERIASIPWCAKYLNKPDVVVETAPSRIPQSTQEHELFSRTLNSPGTVDAFVIFYNQPQNDQEPIQEIKSFLTLGSGLNGYPGVCHGGIVASILDEVLSFFLPLNARRNVFPQVNYMTGYLNTSYLGPIPTSTTVMCVARVVKIDGRKVYLEGHIENEAGAVLAKGDALFIGLKPKI